MSTVNYFKKHICPCINLKKKNRYLHVRKENIYESQQPYRLDNKFFKSNKNNAVELKNIKQDDLKGLNNEQKSVSPSKNKTVHDLVYESKYENINDKIKNSAQIYEEVNEETNNKKDDQIYESLAANIHG